jgi:hypothetical protein
MGVTRRQLGLGLIGAGAAVALADGLGGFALAAEPDGPPNVFISPCGQPFRAKLDAPYPVANWFKQADKNGDGRLDHAEFLADATAFFKMLDLNGDGVLEPIEVTVYEQRVAPEVLGYQVIVGAAPRARLWLAQGMADGMSIDPGGAAAQDDSPPPKAPLDESGQGAAPYNFFNEPEPVAAADLDFNGLIRLSNFLKLADGHFTTLDKDGRGYLTLAALPKTPTQEKVEQWQLHHTHS